MKKKLTVLVLVIGLLIWVWPRDHEYKIKLIETTDVHGNIFGLNLLDSTEVEGGLARVYQYLVQERNKWGDNLILLDNGDMIQGDPSVYYYNYIDTTSTHLAAEVMNYMKYDVAIFGNHEIEAGHAVYDRWRSHLKCPFLGANVINTQSGQPYCKPYEILKRGGLKIAIIGMTTPAIPIWLPEPLWKDLQFTDMEETARHWLPVIKEKENPDLIVGLFHSGKQAHTLGGKYRENASLEVAKNVPGFDVVFFGHDHICDNEQIVNVAGDTVYVLNPANKARNVAALEITVRKHHGKVMAKQMKPELVSMKDYQLSPEFLSYFNKQINQIRNFSSQKIGTISETITTRDAFFGPSAFIDLVHSLQLELTGAQISFVAPFSSDITIPKGEVTVADMFSLYGYENRMNTLRLTGKEIKGALEMSYALWTNQMKSNGDHILLLKDGNFEEGKSRFSAFVNPYFNFDSAAGILYTVDVTKPQGEKITIRSLADGTPFKMDESYVVAVNSYRGNGGGDLLTTGCGLTQEELKERILFSSEYDTRYYFIQHVKRIKDIYPKVLNHWKFVPEDWAKLAIRRDYQLLYK